MGNCFMGRRMVVRRYSKDLEDFHRKFILPFEEWRISGRHWPGGYRWFRSENVFAIEHYKRVRSPGPDPVFRKAG
jgi:hypothetical protein